MMSDYIHNKISFPDIPLYPESGRAGPAALVCPAGYRVPGAGHRGPGPVRQGAGRSHLGPWHPDIECRTIDIERNIRYRRLRYRMHIDIDDFFDSISCIDIECVRYRSSHFSISKVTKGQIDIEVSYFSISTELFSMSYYDIVYDIEGLSDVRYRRSISESISCTI
jgi:hypothetical protein